MALHKVAELEGALLDAAVALAEGFEHPGAVGVNHPTDDGTPWCLSGCNDWWRSPKRRFLCGPCLGFPRQYSEAWEAGGPLIDARRITWAWQRSHSKTDAVCIARCERWDHSGASVQTFAEMPGPDPLVASMRALVASHFGEEVEL